MIAGQVQRLLDRARCTLTSSCSEVALVFSLALANDGWSSHARWRGRPVVLRVLLSLSLMLHHERWMSGQGRVFVW